MKYWKELNELEEAIYNIKSIQAGLNILCQTEEFTCYSPSGITQEHQTFVLDLNERFNTAVEKLNERFQEVWNVVRDDAPWDHYSDLPSPKAYEEDKDEDEDTTPPWEEDLEAIDELENSHRWGKIVEGMMPKESSYPSPNEWSVSPSGSNDFTINFDNMAAAQPTLVVQEIDGNLTTSYRPVTQQDLFDEQWNEAYRRQNNSK